MASEIPLPLHVADLPAATASGAPPLVVLHGFLGAGGNWQTLARRFAATRRVLLPDARNHGRSPHADVFGYAAMAADVAHALAARGVERADLLGHSMGGKTAMTLALTRPALVRRLVVVDIGVGPSPASHADVLGALAAVDLAALRDRADADAALAAGIADAGVRGWLLKNLQRTPEGFRWGMNVPVLHAHVGTVAEGVGPGRFDGPTLVVRGGRSRYVPDDAWPAVLERFPNARLVTVPDAGHWVHADAPDALFDAVAAFLDG